MLRPRFEAVELRYGRHGHRWELPRVDRPLVIAGPNGSGKSTLVEGLVRTLFGFDRRRTTDAARLDARRPWDGEPLEGRVWLARNGERYVVRREFDTGRVRVASPDDAIEHFHGDGNPGGRNQEARQYRRILSDLLGLSELEAYHQTLYIGQGALPDAGLGEHLLRVAAGGHARVDAARHEVAQAHRQVTRRPLHPTAHAAINPRELEKLDEEVAALRQRLEAAREARDRRGPLALERDRTAERLERLDAEIQFLEGAQADLARTGTVEMEARQLRSLTRKLERAADVVATAHAELEAASAARADAARGGLYPADFPERLARAELRWRDIDQLHRRPPLLVLALGVALLALAVGLAATGQPALAVTAAAAIGGLALAAWGALWLDRRRRGRRVRGDVRDVLADVPGADQLGPDDAPRALARFRAQRDAEERVEEARSRLADALRAARSLIREGRAVGVVVDASFTADPVAAVREAAEGARERMVRGRLELERVGEASLHLPDGVVPTEEGVRRALQERRAERARVQEEVRTVAQELMERGAPSESPDALEAALAALEPRRDALERKAAVYEAAHALIADAYDAFRDRDQERLAKLVSEHAALLTDGRLGPVEVRDALDDARVRLDGRLLELGSPPLSYGELHALLLAVRLGAADFLAGVGVLPPLVIDEPFAHLDRDRAAALWALLSRIGAGRQVIVTTQDGLLLEHLGIEPDIALS